MVELAKKLPSIVAIVGLVWALLLAVRLDIDAAFRISVVTAIAGLGGFYLRDWLDRAAPRGPGGN